MDAFYILHTGSLYTVVSRTGEVVCSYWFRTYSEAHAHCEDRHGEVIGDWLPS